MPVKLNSPRWIAVSCVLALVQMQRVGDVAAQVITEPSHPAIDWPMFEDPKLHDATPPTLLHPRMTEMWTAALGQQEGELRRQAVLNITKAHERGFAEAKAFIPALRKIIESGKEQAILRLAAVTALIAMDDRDSAPALLRLAQSGDMDFVLRIDPALAAWNHAPATSLWLERLSGESATRTLRWSVIECLGKVRATEARGALLKLLVEPRGDLSLRMASARALGTIGGLAADDAAAISPTSRSLEDRILAAHVWRGINPQATRVNTLTALTKDSDAGVAQVAFASMLHSDPDAAAANAVTLSRHGDAAIRTLSVQALHAKPSAAAVEPLVALLGDPVAEIRESAREVLSAMARDSSLAAAVRQGVQPGLRATNWQAQRGAVLVAAALKDKSLIESLLGLMGHEKPAVRIATIYALRQTDPAGVADRLAARAAELTKTKPDTATTVELAQIVQSLALSKHAASATLFKSLIPRNAPAGPEARAAAIWGLGLLLEGQTDAALAAQLVSRMNDGRGESPEDGNVRRMAVITLGRIKHPPAGKQLESALKDFAGELQLEVALRWSIERLGGKLPGQAIAAPSYETFGPFEPLPMQP